MITGLLFKQLPKASKPIAGTLTCNEKRMIWWDDPAATTGKVLAEIINPEVVFASTHGIYFKGFEPCGTDKTGRQIAKYQEWWITPNNQQTNQ